MILSTPAIRTIWHNQIGDSSRERQRDRRQIDSPTWDRVFRDVAKPSKRKAPPERDKRASSASHNRYQDTLASRESSLYGVSCARLHLYPARLLQKPISKLDSDELQ